MSTKEFIQNKPKPTKLQALNFCRSVIKSKGAGKVWGSYTIEDGMTLRKAQKALEAPAFDVSEVMALELANYALEG